MSKAKFLSVALIATAMFATPALARENHVRSRHLTENAGANVIIDAGHNDWRSCYDNGAGDWRGEVCGYGDRDIWGHWGGYYGPTVHAP
jgi:hypothetical protein